MRRSEVERLYNVSPNDPQAKVRQGFAPALLSQHSPDEGRADSSAFSAPARVIVSSRIEAWRYAVPVQVSYPAFKHFLPDLALCCALARTLGRLSQQRFHWRGREDEERCKKQKRTIRHCNPYTSYRNAPL